MTATATITYDDVASLMRELTGTSPYLALEGDESDGSSLLDNISAKYDGEEDVGADAHGKLAAIANHEGVFKANIARGL